MLHVFFGNDTETVRRSAYAKIEELRKHSASLAVSQLEATAYVTGQLLALSATVSLFGGEEAYIIDTPEENLVYKEELLRDATALARSPVHFIVITGPLLAPEKKALLKADSQNEYKREALVRFNSFSLAEALSRKDKRSLWLLLQEAAAARLPAEEIIGMLWWQLKTLRLAERTTSAAEAGIKEFPYNKAKRALANFKPGEVEMLSRSLLRLYHDGHAGKRDINLALEEWVLRM
jgi:DNA polymerase III delta subunit